MASLQGILVHGIVDSLPMASIWVIPPKSITSAVPHRAVQEAWRAKRLSGYGWCYFRMPRAVWFTDNLQELEDQESWPRNQVGSWSHKYKSWENHGIYSVYAPGKNLASVPEADMRAFRASPWTLCWSKLERSRSRWGPQKAACALRNPSASETEAEASKHCGDRFLHCPAQGCKELHGFSSSDAPICRWKIFCMPQGCCWALPGCLLPPACTDSAPHPLCWWGTYTRVPETLEPGIRKQSLVNKWFEVPVTVLLRLYVWKRMHSCRQ